MHGWGPLRLLGWQAADLVVPPLPCGPARRAGYVRLVNFSQHSPVDMQHAISQLKVRGSRPDAAGWRLQ